MSIPGEFLVDIVPIEAFRREKNSKNCGEITKRKDTFQVLQSNKCKYIKKHNTIFVTYFLFVGIHDSFFSPISHLFKFFSRLKASIYFHFAFLKANMSICDMISQMQLLFSLYIV